MKCLSIRKNELMTLFIDDMIVYIEITKNSIYTLLKLIKVLQVC